jgi:hypothetical protein
VVVSFDYPVVGIEPLTEDVLTAIPDTGTFQWLRCDDEFEPIPDATDAIFQVLSSGNYAVVMTNGICSDTSECLEVLLTSTHGDQSDQAIRIYPNPVKDVFYLEGNLQHDEVELTLTDMRGMHMSAGIYREDSRLRMDISALSSGVYVLRVYVKGVGYRVERVVKV